MSPGDLVGAALIAVSLHRMAWREFQRRIAHLHLLLALHGGTDPWDLRCECCHRRIKDAPVIRSVTQSRRDDGSIVSHRSLAWHADRPKCAADCAAHPDVRQTFLGGPL